MCHNSEVFVCNRPFPSSKKSHFQSEAKCEAIDMKMIFNYYANISHFHNKGFALSLVLKVRFFGTRKWPINDPPFKYLLSAEFSVCTVNYGPSFFPSIHGRSAKRAGHKSMEKKRGSVIYSTD